MKKILRIYKNKIIRKEPTWPTNLENKIYEKKMHEPTFLFVPPSDQLHEMAT